MELRTAKGLATEQMANPFVYQSKGIRGINAVKVSARFLRSALLSA